MDPSNSPVISAVIAAAGFSRRMGDFKQLLPWDNRTVIEAVVGNLHDAGADPVLCIVGHRAGEVATALADSPARVLLNADYVQAEMLGSYQTGVRALLGTNPSPTKDGPNIPAGTLLALGDQPHIPISVIRLILEEARATVDRIVVPSHRMRRGHPIYLPRSHWAELMALQRDDSLRDLLNRHQDEIVYVTVETEAVRQDMDTWQEYEARRRAFGDSPEENP